MQVGLKQFVGRKCLPAFLVILPLDEARDTAEVASLMEFPHSVEPLVGGLELQLNSLEPASRSVYSPSCPVTGKFISPVHSVLTFMLAHYGCAKDCHHSLD